MAFNYKGFYSIVLMAVVDANYKFIFVDVGEYGSVGDSTIFGRSSFGQRLVDATLGYDENGLDLPMDTPLPGTNVRVPHVFLGDQAFALQRHLMRPYVHHSATRTEESFNYRLSRARRVSENAFGILTTRWRVLESKLNLDAVSATDVVKACIALHNYLTSTDSIDHQQPRYIPENYVDYESENGDLVMGEWRNDLDHNYCLFPLDQQQETNRSHYRIRESFKNYFTSAIRAVPWQHNIVDSGLY